MKILLIITKAGLCNRLQELLSWRDYGLSNKFEKIYFIWCNTSHCNSKCICDIIDNIPNIKILERHKKYTDFENFIMDHIYDRNTYHRITRKINYFDTLIEMEMVGGSGKNPDFNIINPIEINFTSTIVKKVTEYINTYLEDDYIAIHLRKQDNNLLIDYELIDNLIEEYKHKKVYIATDSVDLQNKYKTHEHVMYNRSINHSWSVNRSNVEDAVFDILICSKATVFCGTPNRNERSVQSSYSNFIYGLRGVYEEAISPKYYNKHFIHY